MDEFRTVTQQFRIFFRDEKKRQTEILLLPTGPLPCNVKPILSNGSKERDVMKDVMITSSDTEFIQKSNDYGSCSRTSSASSSSSRTSFDDSSSLDVKNKIILILIHNFNFFYFRNLFSLLRSSPTYNQKNQTSKIVHIDSSIFQIYLFYTYLKDLYIFI